MPWATAWPTTAPRSRRRSTSTRAVHVPAGTYRLDSEVQVKPRRRLHGAGRDVTIIDARGPRAFTFQRNEGAYRIDGDAGSDWCRSSLSRHADRA